jgi:EAL domain-containing protein (putative c-di-GMP-specific phosphodiesterase class I)
VTVRKLGVDYAQGFHLGRPEPIEPDRSARASAIAYPIDDSKRTRVSAPDRI